MITSKQQNGRISFQNQVKAILVKRPDSKTPDLDFRPRLRAINLMNASRGGESDGQNREETAETLEVELTETVE